ncbi:MAG TPA: mannose-1-phosphate guanylyltransferase [Patescibacteria group bacterium]|nr:mannose-1-phosphate guanylyltransferase [Patescibacteria group bacterium]
MLPEVVPVILAGGQGRRLWPLTSRKRPKQFLKLRGQSLLQMTVTRMKGSQPPVVIAGRGHADTVIQHLGDQNAAQIFLEPEGRGTAPAVATVAHYFHGKGTDPFLLVAPCDHLIEKPSALREAIAAGLAYARQKNIIAFGIPAGRPSTAFGYIKPSDDSAKVMEFVEKPDRLTARRYIKENWLWNSGMFLFSASTYLERIKDVDPLLYSKSLEAVTRAIRRKNAVLLDDVLFRECPKISIDKAVMEKDGPRAVIPVEMGWRDLGTRGSFLIGLLGL